MSVQSLFQKPKDVRWVDMCIYIDDHIYEESPDYDTIYTYMYLLSYMLACKKRYFSNTLDYEEFAAFLAYSVFQRMTDADKPKIKSVLNYMNSILYFRKAAFESHRHQEVINPEYNETWDSYSYTNKLRESIEVSNRKIIEESVEELFKEVPGLICKYIPSIYKIDPLTYKNIYKSCMLSMLDKFTLPSLSEDKLQSKLKCPTFDEVKFYKRFSKESIILWHLKEEMSTVVMIVLNKVNSYLIKELKCLSSNNNINDEELSWMLASSFFSGGNNSEANN